MQDFIEYRGKLDQQIRRQFEVPKKYLEANPHITATEVLLSVDISKRKIDAFVAHAYNTMIRPLEFEIFKLYFKQAGIIRLRQYELKMIKTM